MTRGLWFLLALAGAMGCSYTDPDFPGRGTAGGRKSTTPEAVAADDSGSVVEIDGLKSRAPADWKEQEVPEASRRFRVAQFKVPGDGGDAELVVFYFGPGGGGGVEANIERWKKMFVPPEGKKIDDVSKIEKLKAGEVNITLLDVHGTYKFKVRPMDTQEELRPNQRMLSAVFASPNGPYFVRLVGPEKTVDSHRAEFVDWLKAFK